MNRDISFLPQEKQNELSAITVLLREICDDIEMILLYGSYARNEYKEAKDLTQDRWSGHASDYDILVVTGTQETAQNRTLLATMEETCQKRNFSATVRIIMYDLQELNIRLAEGQYFYSDIQKEGIVLYNEKNHILAKERELTTAEQARIAQDHFAQWYKTAEMQFTAFGNNFKLGHDDSDYYRLASFDLHQTTEACYKCILLVYTNYSPDEHYLTILEQQAAEEVPALASIFPRENEMQHKRFTLLDNAYIGARYIRDFIVEKEDIEYLAPLVEKLLHLTEEVCQQRIQEMH